MARNVSAGFTTQFRTKWMNCSCCNITFKEVTKNSCKENKIWTHFYIWHTIVLNFNCSSFLNLDYSFYNNVNITSTNFLVAIIYNLSSVLECQSKCWNPANKNCQFFTFYKQNGTGYSTCYLRSSASGNKAIAENYITGPTFRMIGEYLLFQ